MNVVEGGALSDMLKTMMFVKMSREGHDFDSEIQIAQAEKAQLITGKIDSVREALLGKQQHAVNQVQHLFSEVADVDVFEPAELQIENIEQAYPHLKSAEENLMSKASLMESELAQKQALTIPLQTQLQDFTKQLKKAEGQHYPLQESMNGLAGKIINRTYGKHL